MRIKTAWVRLVAMTTVSLLVSLVSLAVAISQMLAAHGGKIEEMKGIPICVVYAHEGADTGRGRVATSTGGREGGQETKKGGVLMVPPFVSTH